MQYEIEQRTVIQKEVERLMNAGEFTEAAEYLKQRAEVLKQYDIPSLADVWYAVRLALRVLHELTVRVTGDGFVFHDVHGHEGLHLHSKMAMPGKVTFEADKAAQMHPTTTGADLGPGFNPTEVVLESNDPDQPAATVPSNQPAEADRGSVASDGSEGK